MRHSINFARLAMAMACAGVIAAASSAAMAQSSTVTKGSKSAPQTPAAQGAIPGRQGQAQAPKAIIKAKHGDWQIRCEELEVPEETAKLAEQQQGVDLPEPVNGIVKIERCAAIQAAVSKEAENVGVTAIVVRGENQGKQVSVFRILAPLGVFIPTGVALEIDGQAEQRIPYARCLPGGCLAFTGLNDELLAKLKNGSQANLIIYQGPGQGIGVPLSLAGFSKAHAGL